MPEGAIKGVYLNDLIDLDVYFDGKGAQVVMLVDGGTSKLVRIEKGPNAKIQLVVINPRKRTINGDQHVELRYDLFIPDKEEIE